ncbi:ABC transporter substrate-binding protein [Halobacteriales archaeon QS_3_64_16]|nr:MAG: ABC transporter substrate-binding protein [Halobacteriales archaeon QS_3_64_16]
MDERNERNEFTDEDLSGPVVDRRTTMKLLGAAGMAGLAGCTGGGGGSGGSGGGANGSGSGGKPQPGGRLSAGWFTGSVDTLDPPYISVGQYFQVASNVFNGLVTLDKDLTVRGDLAKDWTVEGEGETIRFDLREGVKFHNGTPFTAEDVKYTIERTIKNETPAAEKLSTLPALIYLTRGPGRAATIVNQEAIEKMGQEQYSVTPVGTGPFQVTSHNVGSGITLDAFGEYFGTDEDGTQLPYLDGIDIKPIPEPATLVSALRGGDVDFSNLVPLQNVSQIEKATEVKKLQAPGVNWYGFAMNQEREPFGSRKARRGIAKLINNEQFVETAYFGNAIPARGPINKATEWVWRENKPDDQAYAPEQGKKLVEEAGASGASFSILTTQDSLRPAKAMRQQLTRAGFDASVEQVTSSTYWERYENLDYDTTISGSVGDPDPDQSLWNFYRSDGPWNWVSYEDEKVNQWLAQQRRELDRSERAKTLQKIEDRLIADTPSAYLSHRDDIAARRSNVKGFTHIPYMRNFHTVWLEGSP